MNLIMYVFMNRRETRIEKTTRERVWLNVDGRHQQE
jgi:hypothetical protein